MGVLVIDSLSGMRTVVNASGDGPNGKQCQSRHKNMPQLLSKLLKGLFR